jgi:hypothetical protein
MDRLTITNEATARAAVAELARRFGIREPRTEIAKGRRNSVAYCLSYRIRFGDADWHGWEQATLHEFTHILLYARRTRHAHNRTFYAALCEVIRTAGQVEAEYAWHNEYETLWRYAARDGLTARCWWKTEWRAGLAAANSPPPVRLVSPGQRVSFEFKGTSFTGIVQTADRGCRARVKLDDGRQFYVPQRHLTLV